MPKFLVTKCVDAWVHYKAVVEAADDAEAREIAEDEVDSLDWHEAGVSEMDAVEFDNIEPELVADEYTFGDISTPGSDMAIHFSGQMSLARTYADDGALHSAARVIRDLSDKLFALAFAKDEALAKLMEGRANG